MCDSLDLNEIEEDDPYLTSTDRMPSSTVSDVDSGVPARPGFSDFSSGSPHEPFSGSFFDEDGLFKRYFGVSSFDEASDDNGSRTSFQVSGPPWPFIKQEGSDEDSFYDPVWCSDEESDSELDEPKEARLDEPKEAQTSGLSTEDEDRAISELAAKVLDYARTGMEADVTEQCVAVMSKVRGIPREGRLCVCDICFMSAPWRHGLVARMNSSCGAYAWGESSGLVVGPGQTSSLIDRTWKSVSDLIEKWGYLVGSNLEVPDYRTFNACQDGKSFSPVKAAGHTYFEGMGVMASGCEGMLNGAGMYEHYPATDNKIEEMQFHDSTHRWINCAVDPPRRVKRPAWGPYACVSHTWGRYCCNGDRDCQGTGEYRKRHVCSWGKNNSKVEDVYWDERDIEAAVVAAGWKGLLWLDWVDVPVQKGWPKVNKIKTQSELYLEADRVYVFVPESDFVSITEAIRLSEAADTCNDFVKLIRQLSALNWFTSTWTLQEMFLSYKRMVVITDHRRDRRVIQQGWLEQLRDRLSALVDRFGVNLDGKDLTRLTGLGVLLLGHDASQMIVAALMRSGGKTHGCCIGNGKEQVLCRKDTHHDCGGRMCVLRVFDSIRYGLIKDVPNGLPACAQLVSMAVQQHDVSWLAFKAAPSNGRVVPVYTLPMYGATWPATGKWHTVCDLLATGAGLLWFGMTGMVTLQTLNPDQYWLDADVESQGLLNVESKARVIVICMRPAQVPTDERWLGLIVSGDSGRTRRLGGCILQALQIEDFKSGAVLVW